MNKRSKKAKEKILNNFVSNEEVDKVIKAMEKHMTKEQGKVKEIKYK